MPGGVGAAKNLSNFATLGSECTVDRDLKALAQAMHPAGKPLGFMCLAPAILQKIFDFPLRLTIGTDIDTAEVLEEMGAEHVPCPVDDIVVDEDNKIVTMCRVLSMISWLMKTIRLSPPRHICWRRTLQKRRAALISWFPACWFWLYE